MYPKILKKLANKIFYVISILPLPSLQFLGSLGVNVKLWDLLFRNGHSVHA